MRSDGHSMIVRYEFVLALTVGMMIAPVCSGCAKPVRELAPLSGKVTCGGKPLQFGNVMLQPENGPPATGIINADGTFQMITRGVGDGVGVGRNLVRISCFENQSPSFKHMKGKELALGNPLIPQRYSNYDTSGITFDVRAGNNEPLLIDLMDH